MKNKLLIAVLLLTLIGFSGCKKEEPQEEPEEKKFTLEEEVETEDVEKEEFLNYVLYLKFDEQDYLYDEMYSVNKKDIDLENQTVEEFLLQQLIDVKPVRNLLSPIPEGTKVLGIQKEEGIVTVNLSKEFNKNGMTKAEAGLALASVVNTLTLLEGNEQVKILIEGEELPSYYEIKTDQPLYFIESFFPDK